MTTRKGFKRLVRARAAKTGESYATARRVLLGEAGSNGPPSTGDPSAGPRGLHPDTASMAIVLAARGVVSPVTGRPLSEALLLVAGGGLGAGYILWEFESRKGALLTLGFRNQWQYPGIPGWFGKTAERLGLPDRPARDERRQDGPRGARCGPRRWQPGRRDRRPAVDGSVGPAARVVGLRRLPGRRHRQDRRRFLPG